MGGTLTGNPPKCEPHPHVLVKSFSSMSDCSDTTVTGPPWYSVTCASPTSRRLCAFLS
jgi:hypothetical protein